MNLRIPKIFLMVLLAVMSLAAAARLAASAPVTLAEDARTYTLDNGLVTVIVAKESGDLVSYRYRGTEMLATFVTEAGQPDLERDPPGANPNGLNRGMTDHQYGFWSHDAMGPRGTAPAITRITINPSTNGGQRAEVSIKGIAEGRKMGTGPGARADGQFAADVEIRYALGRGESGVYTYCIFEHKPGYPATSLGEARFCAKLADHFDWMSIAPQWNEHYPKGLNKGNKYIYTVVQSENPAFGWSSTTKNVGFWLINASMEYISGGPTKVEFLGHRDTNTVAAPCVLNYWRSSHYGGALVDVAEDEHWTKVVGPFLLYANTGGTPQIMYDDARRQQRAEAATWPYAWVKDAHYPLAHERATVTGRLQLNDPLMPGATKSRLQVGLTPATYVSPRPPAAEGTPPAPPAPVVNWQRDAKYYQFWTQGGHDGRFEISNVRPGRYTLHAFADGVLGEYAQTDIVVEAGKPLDLGNLNWTPVRHGRQVWEIGIPNRNASEFAGAHEYWMPTAPYNYPKKYPNDVTFVVGQSDFRTDWYFQHIPHSENPEAAPGGFFTPPAPGRATPYTVAFDFAGAPRGKATLRLAICGTGGREIEVTVNGQPAGRLERLPGDGTIARHGIQGIWYEREVAFDAALLKSGANTLTLTVPAAPITNGVLYDYLRLELDESARVSVDEPTTTASPLVANNHR